MHPELIASASRLENWITQQALPLWSAAGINPDTGASYERFLAGGNIDISADTRLRVQARQMFVFSLAAELGWLENAQVKVDGIAGFVAARGVHPSGQGYVHLLSPDNRVKNPMRDLYDHAFFLLACAWRYRAFKDSAAMEEANRLIAFMDEELGQQCGGWLEGDYPTDRRRQNPHMHLFEAFLALYDASGDAKWLARAGEMFALFETRFFDPRHKVLREYFNQDWTPFDGADGNIVEPGHMLEWVWLLRGYQSRTGRRVDHYADALYTRSLEIGLTDNGLLYDEVSPEGNVITPSKRCWPMTELIKASIAQAREGREGCEENAANAIEALMAYYLQAPVPGAYIDRLDNQDQVLVDFAPASTLYHLIVAAAEVSAYVRGSEAPPGNEIP